MSDATATSPRVTVIIATYNWAPVLSYSIGSVLDQTFADFELLVIGDGCTDDSAEVVAGVGDPRVHWHNLDDRFGHQAGPNNEGIRRARGELIAYLGHDDLWTPRHLELLLEAVDAGTPFVHSGTLWVHPSRRPSPWPPPRWVYTPGWVPPTTVLHPRNLALAVGGWRPPHATGALDPDGDLWERMAASVGPPRFVADLTSVKISAAQRRDVYRDRPSHEQAYWLARIRATGDPEGALLAASKQRYVYVTRVWRHRLSRPVTILRGSVRARTRLRARGLLPQAKVTTADKRLRRQQRFKGIDVER